MSLATVSSRALTGVTARAVTVEVHLANGLPGLSLVGLPDTEVKESRERVRSALQNSQFEFPARRITAIFRTSVVLSAGRAQKYSLI